MSIFLLINYALIVNHDRFLIKTAIPIDLYPLVTYMYIINPWLIIWSSKNRVRPSFWSFRILDSDQLKFKLCFCCFYDYQGVKNVFLVKILQFQIINRDRKFEKLYNSKVKTDDKSLLVQNVNEVKILKYSIFNLKKTTLPGLNFKMFSFKS